MRRLYTHAECVYDGGKVVCRSCGAEVGDCLLSEEPCSIPTAWYTEFDEAPGLLWFVNVYNLKASLMAARMGNDRSSMRFFRADTGTVKLDELLEESVYEQGGAINISGHYGLTDSIAAMVRELVREGTVRVLDDRA